MMTPKLKCLITPFIREWRRKKLSSHEMADRFNQTLIDMDLLREFTPVIAEDITNLVKDW